MNKRVITLSVIIAVAALCRLLPHPPNVTPIGALALFAGAHFRDRRIAFLLPIAAMFFSDLVIGFAVYGASMLKSQPAVYLSMLITVGIGQLIRNKRSISKVAVWRLRCIRKIFRFTKGAGFRIKGAAFSDDRQSHERTLRGGFLFLRA